jgi:hypothetical protein
MASTYDTLTLTAQVADYRYWRFLNYDRDAITLKLASSVAKTSMVRIAYAHV